MNQMEKPKPDRSDSIKDLQERWVKKNAPKQIKPTEEKPPGKATPDKKKR